MNKQIFFFSTLAIMILGSWSCNKSNDPAGCSTAWATDLSNEITALSNAAQAYAVDPSQQNCLAYKSAMQAYIDALEPYGNCASLTGQSRTEWQNAINDAQQSIDDMNCQ